MAYHSEICTQMCCEQSAGASKRFTISDKRRRRSIICLLAVVYNPPLSHLTSKDWCLRHSVPGHYHEGLHHRVCGRRGVLQSDGPHAGRVRGRRLQAHNRVKLLISGSLHKNNTMVRYKSQTVIRNVLGTRNLTQILNDRDGISAEMVDALQVKK